MTSPLSQPQLSMYLASQGLDDKSGNYQQAMLFRLTESIDLEKFRSALDASCFPQWDTQIEKAISLSRSCKADFWNGRQKVRKTGK